MNWRLNPMFLKILYTENKSTEHEKSMYYVYTEKKYNETYLKHFNKTYIKASNALKAL